MSEKTVYYRPEYSRPHLIAIAQGAAKEYVLDGEQILGRPSSNSQPDIPAASGVVSRRHGRFLTDPSGCRYCDESSMNGTLLNGNMLDAGKPVVLSDGDILRIHGQQDDACEMDVLLIFSTTESDEKSWVKLPLDEAAEVVIGRDTALQLQEESVSRKHASVFFTQNGWALIDHGSVNGVFLNAVRIGEPVYLHPYDVFRIADYYFVFLGDCLLCQKDTQEGLSVLIEERNVWQRAKKKTLLRNIQLEIAPGSMVLILGGSGAGKTTFMNAVMGYERADGVINYAGTDIYKEYERMKYEIGYVPQQDLLRMNDTVYDTLQNAARMKLPVMPDSEYEVHITETLNLLGLENLKDSLVSKLSGGQRKRLSIAVEYIGNPSLFFLDEPDSGLDGMMARRLMEKLRTIADQGKIVLVISHSPDRAAELYDQVIVLAKSSEDIGRLVFYGSPDEALRFFEVKDLEGIMGRINYPDEGGEGLADHYIQRFESRRK